LIFHSCYAVGKVLKLGDLAPQRFRQV